MNDDPGCIEAALMAIGRRELCAIRGMSRFTFPYDAEDDVIFTDELRAKVEARLGEPLIGAVLPGLEGQVTLLPRSEQLKLEGVVWVAARAQEDPFYGMRNELDKLAVIADERREMLDEAFGMHYGISSPDLQGGCYTGKVTHISKNGNFFVQDVGRSKAVIHETGLMDCPVKLEEVFSINYRAGRALPESKGRECGKGHTR